MALTVNINASNRTSRVMYRSMSVEKVLSIETAGFDVYDPIKTTAAYRPQVGHEVTIYHGSDLLFGGEIVTVQDQRPAPDNRGGALTRVRCRGFDKFADERVVNKTFSAGQTVLAVANALVSQFLAPKGVTNISPTSGGPTLPELVFEMRSLRSCLDELTTLSGYMWRINGLKQFAMHAPGAIAGPHPISDLTNTILGALDWERSILRRNTILWMRTGSAPEGTVTPIARVDSFTGNGAKSIFYLTARPDEAPTAVVQNGVSHPIGGGTWNYDAPDNAITRVSPATAGHAITVTYPVTPPAWVRVIDPSIIVASGSYDPALAREDVISGDTVQTIDQALDVLAAELGIQIGWDRRKINTRVRSHGWYPGQSVVVVVDNRDTAAINASYLVHTVRVTDPGITRAQADDLFYDLTLIEGGDYFPSWIDMMRRREGGSVSGGSTIGSGGSGGGGTGAAGMPARYFMGGNNASYASPMGVVENIPYAVPMTLGGPRMTAGSWQMHCYAYRMDGDATSEIRFHLKIGASIVATSSWWSPTAFSAPLLHPVTMPASEGEGVLQWEAQGTPANWVCGMCMVEET